MAWNFISSAQKGHIFVTGAEALKAKIRQQVRFKEPACNFYLKNAWEKIGGYDTKFRFTFDIYFNAKMMSAFKSTLWNEYLVELRRHNDSDGALGTTMNSRTLSLRCENASIPGRTLATSDLRIYGPTEKYPYQSTYDDITLTFICDDNMMEKTAFDNWMEQINPKFSWNFDYKANYATRITIIQYDNADNEVHKINLVDAFPVAVSQLDFP